MGGLPDSDDSMVPIEIPGNSVDVLATCPDFSEIGCNTLLEQI